MAIRFEKNVEFLRRNIPPDDIYLFAELTFMASLYFLKKWSNYTDINKECEECEVTKKWVSNIMLLLHCKENDTEVNLDLNLKSVEDGPEEKREELV